MDPITAIGAVASIVQLAQVALSLSKTLYSLGSAVASANDDIQALADDLKTFSQSLTLLSRLLEDSKSWYSDEIYVMTAKIIKDCAELYVKIDKILVKLGGNGKSTWKMRVKFVYKEGQIRKLMKRLRDMKGTLATILMSLQVDLQLSLLNISSSSKIQREPERPLQPETIQTLADAQKVAEQTGYLSNRTIYTQQTVHSSEKCFGKLTAQYEQLRQISDAGGRGINGDWPQRSVLQDEPQSSSGAPIQPISERLRGIETDSSNISHISAMRLFQPITMMVDHQIPENMAQVKVSSFERTLSKSPKSKSSVESFQTAVSVQQSLLEPEEQLEMRDSIDQELEAVRNVLHAFETALEVFSRLVEKRCLDAKQGLYLAAKDFEKSLADGERELKGTHDRHLKLHGVRYVQAFTSSDRTALQHVSSSLMTDIVMPLHRYSADHVHICNSDFETLRTCSERCRSQAVFIVVGVALSLTSSDPEININSQSSGSSSWMAAKIPVRHATSCLQPRTPNADSESSLPFIGYTFKRLDNAVREEIQSAKTENIIRPEKKDPGLPTCMLPGYSPSSAACSPTSPLMNSLNTVELPYPYDHPGISLQSMRRRLSAKDELTPIYNNPPQLQQQMIIQQQRQQQAAGHALPEQTRPQTQSGVPQSLSMNQDRKLRSPVPDQAIANSAPNSSTISQQLRLQHMHRDQQMPPLASDSGMPQPQPQGFQHLQHQMQAYPLSSQQLQTSQAPVNEHQHLDSSALQSLTASMNPQQRQRLASLPPDKLNEILNRWQKARQSQTNYTQAQMSNSSAFGSQPKMEMPGNRSVHVPAAPTSTQPPFQFRAYSPQGIPVYLGEMAITQESLHIPPRNMPMPGDIAPSGPNAKNEIAPPTRKQAIPQRPSLSQPPKQDMPASNDDVVEVPNPNAQPSGLSGSSLETNKMNEITQAQMQSHRDINRGPANRQAQSPSLPRSFEYGSGLGRNRIYLQQQATPATLSASKITTQLMSTPHRGLPPPAAMTLSQPPQQSPVKAGSVAPFATSVASPEDPWQQSNAPDHFMDASMAMPSARIELGPDSLESGPRSRRQSIAPYNSYSNLDEFNGEKSMTMGRCTYPACGELFIDLRSHMLTHLNQQSEMSYRASSSMGALQKRREPVGQVEERVLTKRRKLDANWEAGDGPNHHEVLPNKQPVSDLDKLNAAGKKSNELFENHDGKTDVNILPLVRLRSDDPFKKLWWQAYFSLNTSQPTIFESLSSTMEKIFGIYPSDMLARNLLTGVEDMVHSTSAENWGSRPYLMPLAADHANIVRIVMTISSQLSLERPVMGWACVGFFLSIYNQVLETWGPTLSTTNIEAITKAFQQVQDIAGLLARYAVMETLYHQGPSLTLTSEYEDGLQDLCFTILQYFGNAFIMAKAVGQESSEYVEESGERCDALIEEIKGKDKICQGFRVIVEADDGDNDSEGTVIEDVSDGSWEVLDSEVSSTGVLVN